MRLRSTSASRTRSQSPHAASAAAIRDLKVARSPLARAGRAGRRTRTAGARHQRPPAAGPEALGRDGNRRRPHASAGPPTRMKSRASQLAGGGFRRSPRRRSRAVRTRIRRRAVCRRSQQISVSGFCRNAVASAQNRSMAPARMMTSCTATRTRIIPWPSSLALSSAPARPRSSARRWPAAHDPPRNCVDREPRGRCPPAAGAAAGAGDGGLDADVWCRSPDRGVPAESRRGTGRGRWSSGSPAPSRWRTPRRVDRDRCSVRSPAGGSPGGAPHPSIPSDGDVRHLREGRPQRVDRLRMTTTHHQKRLRHHSTAATTVAQGGHSWRRAGHRMLAVV